MHVIRQFLGRLPLGLLRLLLGLLFGSLACLVCDCFRPFFVDFGVWFSAPSEKKSQGSFQFIFGLAWG